MLYAIDASGNRVQAVPKIVAICPWCKEKLIPKCGPIKIWHFSHRSREHCPANKEETEWHRWWKSLVLEDFCEVRLGCHYADILGHHVIELQHSSISADEIREREACYGNMLWLFDAKPFQKNITFQFMKGRGGRNYHRFRWSHPRQSLWYCEKPMYFDFGLDNIFEMRSIRHELPCTGWGYFLTYQEFALKRLGGVLRSGWQRKLDSSPSTIRKYDGSCFTY